MIRCRLEFENAVTTTQRWNEDIADCEAVDDMNVKHRRQITCMEKKLYEQHGISCYDYRAPRVVFSAESREEGGSSSWSHQPAGRGRRPGPQPQSGFSRADMKRHLANKQNVWVVRSFNLFLKLNSC